MMMRKLFFDPSSVTPTSNGLSVPHPTALSFKAKWMFIILWGLPPIFIVFLLCRLAVDVPVWDDFTIGETVLALSRHGFNFEQLIAQHNESRPAFARLLFWLLFKPTRFDVRYQMYASFAVVLCSGLLLTRICRKTIDLPLPAAAASVLVNFLLFSPVQWQNFLWGIQFIVFVPTLALTVTMICLGSLKSFSIAMPLSAVAALVATFCNSNGMLVWFLAIPFFLVHPSPSRIGALLVWMVFALSCIGFYLHGYVKPWNHPPMSLALHAPKDAINFLLAFLGNGVRWGHDFDLDVCIGRWLLMGWALPVFFVVAQYRNLRLLRRALPWIGLGGYSIASGILTTLGRFGFGNLAAITERYPTFSIPLWFSLVPLSIIASADMLSKRDWSSRLAAVVALSAFGAIAGLILVGCISVRVELLKYHAQMLAARTAAQFALVVPDRQAIESTLLPAGTLARRFIAQLDQDDLFPPQCFRTNDIASIAVEKHDSLVGYFDSMVRTGDTLSLSGWASLPPHRLPADAVLLTVPDTTGTERIFAIVTETFLPRIDVAETTKCQALNRSGWVKSLDAHALLRGAKVSAWAFDTYHRRAYRLALTHSVP